MPICEADMFIGIPIHVWDGYISQFRYFEQYLYVYIRVETGRLKALT